MFDLRYTRTIPLHASDYSRPLLSYDGFLDERKLMGAFDVSKSQGIIASSSVINNVVRLHDLWTGHELLTPWAVVERAERSVRCLSFIRPDDGKTGSGGPGLLVTRDTGIERWSSGHLLSPLFQTSLARRRGKRDH